MEYYKILFAILGILLTAFFTCIIPRKLKERQKFNESAANFRDVFRYEIAFLRYNTCLKGCQSTDCSITQFLRTGMQHRHTSAFIIFTNNLSKSNKRKIDKAWEKYKNQIDNYKSFPPSKIDKEKALNTIESFLNKTEEQRIQGFVPASD